MTKDPIVEEVRRIREEQAEKHGFDVDSILKSAKKRQDKSNAKVVSFVPGKKKPAKATSRPRAAKAAR